MALLVVVVVDPAELTVVVVTATAVLDVVVVVPPGLGDVGAGVRGVAGEAGVGGGVAVILALLEDEAVETEPELCVWGTPVPTLGVELIQLPPLLAVTHVVVAVVTLAPLGKPTIF